MFLVCGEALYDLFVTETRPDGGAMFDARVGGSPFNVAFGLARLGRPVGYFTGLSNDFLGRRLMERVLAEGVDPRFVVRKPNLTTLSLVALDGAGVPSYAFYGEGAADRALTMADLPSPDAMKEVKALHLGSFSTIAPTSSEVYAALVRREAGKRLISLDPNIRPTVQPDLGVWRAKLDELLPSLDILKISLEDFELLYPGRALESAAADWLKAGPRLVVVTLGADGAVGFAAEGGRAQIPGERVGVIDTVGAGDSFMAAMLTGLDELSLARRSALGAMSGATLGRILAFGAKTAAIVCSRRGADVPRRNELPALG